ncbi:hypothetical protein A3H04_02865 [Candidatus Giovannonibacteria bacterium RIFCSPLOWO2_12_FULL_43_11c]|uniref:RecF/RecN/SMC N-terminal domain-containing protein n=1 Tax=Candidatus Giovannonibacteria bacterium RIFCSPHIGHO2_12_FULL_43_15 TaxID=1798341 RepID=A0A1F5WPY3_9BACT|nr:MAG: hypothetical protein A2739_03170 [Candidatus Giovannonibacteria bacterium RIFCSPHIGHO2_01_FULL_43_100]OGF66357.1 MAG: hypothetical protein A3B97_03025 [Candidatus Giovannonibacteria bacterium RIFCSPHIGHO2_02_FULL_43_32]OGF77716.1 MAG: hypothetical protein A3F23_01500 [Candidatus Giovannonibacteria bacterium RIFCSPHIGHO2_12_FULL_43_15]OGF78057.1 MAG: hypothetical protein A3A15_01855 [Candidatus Giovannonibacteria bacterium RIFCSPLOWO2_01_FULL_43_60]OGF91805.1 MAG: hypothetical protein A3
MQLKRLELFGFKSFAKNTVLEFPRSISAVVGPNGSGKSNVADAIRWVLGEQSIKSLRGKKGEDMIFAGSAALPRMQRASAVMVFDNSKQEFPLGFDEVSIGRRVYRDSSNEYLINGSDTRLKDTIELLAKVGFGSTQHHIIGQGEADRILYASPAERREMIEDALGLKIFHLRRSEAQRKLARTEENIKQVQSIQKEIQPHLKFLKSQADKFKIASELRENLKKELVEYLSKKLGMTEEKSKKIAGEKEKPAAELRKFESEIASLRKKIARGDKIGRHDNIEEKSVEENLKKIRDEEMSSLRELGRIEGIIGAEERAQKARAGEVISKNDAEKMIKTIDEELDKILKIDILDDVLTALKHLKTVLKSFLNNLVSERREEVNIDEKKKELASLKAKIERLAMESKELAGKYGAEIARARKEAEETRQDEKRVYQLELEAGKVKDALRSIELEEEKVKLLKEEYEREVEESENYLDKDISVSDAFSSTSDAEASRKKVERIKVRLEEAGGIDPTVIKEYSDVSARDEYLSRELTDMEESKEKLEEMMDELEEKLIGDFKTGIYKINVEFQKFFEMMFGGGSASMEVIKRDKRKKVPAESLEDIQTGPPDFEYVGGEEGVDIIVDLPRKKIKSLDTLSGGERALTSIALLFAMSAVNPPPFLVLDETDAALDEANSQRYAKMLENLSKQTQLILITHNRNTMKCAGILYGVTMGSDGISKLLSIKFEEAGALVS